MDAELADRLDRSIGPAPDSDDELAGLLAGLLASGHEAVRRRRVATVAGAAAAVLVVAGGVAVATSGGPDRAAGPVGEPTSSSTSSPTAPASTAPAPATPTQTATEWGFDDQLAVYSPETGELLVDPAATVVRRVDNPFDVPPPARSVGLVLEKDGQRYWYALYSDDSSGGAATTPAGAEEGPFLAWLGRMSAIASTDDPQPGSSGTDYPGQDRDDLVAFATGSGELLAPRPGVVVLEQRAGVDVGAPFGTAADDTAAATVRTADGQVFHVLARRSADAAAQYIAVPRSKGGADLDAFLEFARARYAGGSGLL